MALEAGDGFISGLVATNPVNATDQVAQGDDHIRLIKTALKGSFPNVNGAVNFTPAQANVLASMAALTVLANATSGAAAPTALAAGANDRILRRTGDTLNFGQLTAGMFPNAVVPDAALSSNIPLKNAINVFSALAQTLFNAGGPYLWLVDSDASAAPGYRVRSNGNQFSVVSTTGADNSIDTAISVTSDGSAITIFTIKGATLNFTGAMGTSSTPGTSALEVGYQGTPLNTQNGDYTLALTDRGGTIYKASGGAGETITIPANASVAFPIGTQIDIVNDGGGDLTIAITSDTLEWALGGGTGSRTLASAGWAVIKKVTATKWKISGAGLS